MYKKNIITENINIKEYNNNEKSAFPSVIVFNG
jgi:hypothetical protein